MVHYDVQLIGGLALHEGRIAEMATGEGKTLVATFDLSQTIMLRVLTTDYHLYNLLSVLLALV